MEINKCDEAKLAHAWRDGNSMWGMTMQSNQTCANCGLTRTKHYDSREWWSYSDGRANEEIFNIRPL